MSNQFKKDSLSSFKRIVAQNLAHAGRNEDEETGEVTYTISFLVITGNASIRYTRPCTKEVFKKCYGRHPDNDPNTLPSGGWCTQIGKKYYVYVSGKKDKDWVVERVSSFPATVYTPKTAPEAMMEQEDLEIQYDPDGSFQVVHKRLNRDVSLPVFPVGLSLAEFGEITAALDKKDEISMGDTAYRNWAIHNIAGGRITLRQN